MKKSAILGLLAAVEARKHLVTPHGKRIREPKVGSDICDPVCIFEDENKTNYWCLEFTDPHEKMGWEWLQSLTETDDTPAKEYFQMDLRFYLETYFYVKSTFDTPRLYYNKFITELKDFKAYIWIRGIMNQDWQYCPGIGWGNELIELDIQMVHKMQQCAKVLINDTCTFEDVWYGRNAKIFEECKFSQDGTDELDLEFYTLELAPKQEDMTWAGTSQPYSDVYCKPLPLIGKTTAGGAREENMSLWAKQAYLAAGNWFKGRYGSENKVSQEKTFKQTPSIPQYKLPW